MSKSTYFFRSFGVLERVPWWLMNNLMDFPILLLAILSAVASNEAFGAFPQIIIGCIAIPAQFAPFFDRTLDFNSKLFLDEFAHFKVIGNKTVTNEAARLPWKQGIAPLFHLYHERVVHFPVLEIKKKYARARTVRNMLINYLLRNFVELHCTLDPPDRQHWTWHSGNGCRSFQDCLSSASFPHKQRHCQ